MRFVQSGRRSLRTDEVVQPVALDSMNIYIGAWRRPVARLHGVQEVVGSNPIAPTERSSQEGLLLSPTVECGFTGTGIIH
jgi:hypothetical protein